MEYRSPDSTEHKIIPAAEACCCGYSGPCPETCGCCETYEGPTLADAIPSFEPCLMQYMPSTLERTGEGACTWSVWLQATGIDNEGPYFPGWPEPGYWAASDGSSGALPSGCMEGWHDWFSTGASIYCDDSQTGQAQWYYRISGNGSIDPYLPEFTYCGDLGNGACPARGSFKYHMVETFTSCEDDPEVWGDDIDGTLTGSDCDNPLP